MNEFESKRTEFKPDKIRYLLIAIAPNTMETFFYNENPLSNAKRGFFNTIRSVIEEEFHFKTENNRDFLIKFKELGFFLIDIFNQQIKLNSNQLIDTLIDHFEELRINLRMIEPKPRIIFMSKDIERAYKLILKELGYEVEACSFPNYYTKKHFQAAIHKIIIE